MSWDLPVDVESLEHTERRSRIEQDAAFCKAMLRAATAGLEHPPMLTVDTRPGTSKPVVLAR